MPRAWPWNGDFCMMTEGPPPPLSEASRREAQIFGLGAAMLFGALFVFYALTLEPPLSPLAVGAFGLLSLALAVGYIVVIPQTIKLPRGPGVPVRLQPSFLTLAWALAFFWLLRGETAIYFALALFDEYTSLALFHGRRWALGWVGVLMGTMIPAHMALLGWPRGMSLFVRDLPTYLLVCGVAELVVRLWEAREHAEALATELEEAYRQLQDYTAKAEALAVSQERTRLAHEIHDAMGHTLTALGLQLELLHRLPPQEDEARRRALARARRLVADAQAEVWRAVQALRPPPLETLTLPEALKQLVANFVQRARRPVGWEVQGQPRPLPEAEALAMYRALQEGLTNVQRHAPDAARITATLRYGDDRVQMIVENSLPETGEPFREGFGLRGLRERAEALGGELHAGPTPEGRFRLVMELPLPFLGERAERSQSPTSSSG